MIEQTYPHKHRKQNNSRLAVVAIVLFLFFDFTALALNVWLSWKIEQQAVAINLAGRQRMLSQRTVKVLLQIANAQAKGQDFSKYLGELRISFDLFDSTLQGFDRGGQTLGGANEVVRLTAVASPAAREAVRQALELWQPYRLQIAEVLLANEGLANKVLSPAIRQAEEKNLKLLELMNALTSALELETQREAARIRLFQGLAFGLALINFFWAFTVYRRRLQRFSTSHDLLDNILNKINASVLVVDRSGCLLKCNQTAEAMFGYRAAEILGKPLALLLKSHPQEIVGWRKDGSHFIAVCDRSYAVMDGRELEIVTVLDVTLQRTTEAQLSQLAYHDGLTKLPNRLLFDERLEAEILQARRRNMQLAVFFIDLDHFKPINDQFGHEAGDNLLQEVASRLRCCLRESDTVARRGGDEFTVIANDIASHENCEKIANIILAQITRPFYFFDQQLQVSCSIGISLFPRDASDAKTLTCMADEAMYSAKQAGRNAYCFYGGLQNGTQSQP